MAEFEIDMSPESALKSANSIIAASRKTNSDLVLSMFQALSQFQHKNNTPLFKLWGDFSGRKTSSNIKALRGAKDAASLRFFNLIVENCIDGGPKFSVNKQGKIKVKFSENGGVRSDKLAQIEEVLKLYRGKVVSGGPVFNDLFPKSEKKTETKIDVERRASNATKGMNVKQLDELIANLTASRKVLEQKPSK
mgnify:FL=1